MEPTKIFNNVIIGQFALTGVSLKVYVNGVFLTITDVEDVEDPNMGFGMDVDGEMHPFNYKQVEKLVVSGNDVTIDTYNKGMEAKFKGGEEAPEEEAPKEDDKESDKLPKESGRGQCGGCHKPIYGLYEEDCRQVILREDYEKN